MKNVIRVAGKIVVLPLVFVLFGISLAVDVLADSDSRNLYYNK